MILSNLMIHLSQPPECWDYRHATAITPGSFLSNCHTHSCTDLYHCRICAAANPVRVGAKLPRIESKMVWWGSKSRFLFNELFLFY